VCVGRRRVFVNESEIDRVLARAAWK